MASNDIFKFVSLRPPSPITRKSRDFYVTIELPDSGFREKLKGDAMNLKKAIELAREFMDSDQYNPDAGNSRKIVNTAFGKNTVSKVKEEAEAILGIPLADYMAGDDRKELESRLWDSLIAHSYLEGVSTINYDNIYNGLRALAYLKATLERHGNSAPISRRNFEKFKPVIPEAYHFEHTKDTSQSKEIDKLRKKVKDQLREVYNRLNYLDRIKTDLESTGLGYKAGKQRETTLSGKIVTAESIDTFKGLGKQKVKDASFRKGISTLVGLNNNNDNNNRKKMISELIIPASEPWVFSDFGQKNLGTTTKSYLKRNAKILTEKEDIEIRAEISREMNNEVENFMKTVPKMFLGDIIETSEFRWIQKKIPLPLQVRPKRPLIPMAETGYSRGIRPLGIGDLMVVRQELMKYTLGEVAHIENVMQSESKIRTHKRITESEETLAVTSEQIEETQRDLQTTERFELQKESQETIETDMQVKAGFNISASYGVVTASAHGDFSYGESSSETNRSASSFAKEVIDKSVSKLVRKSKEERTIRTLERVEEINEHGLNNSEGAGHIRGLYRWVDKHYKARVINYGKRMMFEFIIPEPAAFYIHTEADRSEKGVTLKKPEAPTIWGTPLKPSHLTKSNYTDFISKYNVQDAEPYPDEIVRVSMALAEAPGAGGDKNVHFGTSSEKLKVPDGYKAVDFYGYAHYGGYDGDYYSVYVGGTDFSNASIHGVEGIIPISVAGWGADYNVSINVKCELKDDGIERWQLKTYESIMNAYHNELAAYNEQVIASQIQSGIAIEGRNPAFNRTIEQDELRRAALRILSHDFERLGIQSQWYDDEVFNAMQDSGEFGYPEFNIDEAKKEGQIAQFFEQAFEWNNMTYFFYPYFWGRKADWDDTFSKEDNDPAFTDFLRSGSARVVVPVHPSYNEAILFYLKTNRIWLGGTPPTLDDPLFISIIDEIKADTETELGEDLPVCDIDSGYPCLADEWDVLVPTNLVYLQEDAVLPDNS